MHLVNPPRTFDEVLSAIRQSIDVVTSENPGAIGDFDQQAVRARAELEQLNLDIVDPETARVAGAIVALVISHGQYAMGTLKPRNAVDYVRFGFHVINTLNGINVAIGEAHRGRST